MRLPTSRLDALIGSAGVVLLSAQRVVADVAAQEPVIHTIRDVADTIMKVGGAAAIIAAVFFWILKKLLRPQIEAAIRGWFKDDIKKFRRSIQRVQECADAMADHADTIGQTDDDILLVLDWIASHIEEEDDKTALMEQILGIERRQPDRRARELGAAVEAMHERRRNPGRRFAERHPNFAARLEERRRARGRGESEENLRDLRTMGDPTRPQFDKGDDE